MRDVPNNHFSLVLNLITLQHISDSGAIRNVIREFARVAEPGGLIVFQLPAQVSWRVRLRPRYLIARVLRRMPRQPRWLTRLTAGAMTLTGMPESTVRELLTAAGTEISITFPDNRVGSDAVPSVCYVARKAGTECC